MARQVSRVLVQCGCTVMSGLASGVDTSAHRGALEAGGRTVAIIGTALFIAFPHSNQSLQDLIGREHLLMSHVPFSESAEKESVSFHFLFRERLQTIAALSLATVVVEATGAGAAMLQAREALRLGKKVIVMSSSIKDMLLSGCDSRESENVIVSDLGSLELKIDSALWSSGA